MFLTFYISCLCFTCSGIKRQGMPKPWAQMVNWKHKTEHENTLILDFITHLKWNVGGGYIASCPTVETFYISPMPSALYHHILVRLSKCGVSGLFITLIPNPSLVHSHGSHHWCLIYDKQSQQSCVLSTMLSLFLVGTEL